MQHSGQVLADGRKDHKAQAEVRAPSGARMVFRRRDAGRTWMERVQDREGQGLLSPSPPDARPAACDIQKCSNPPCVVTNPVLKSVHVYSGRMFMTGN